MSDGFHVSLTGLASGSAVPSPEEVERLKTLEDTRAVGDDATAAGIEDQLLAGVVRIEAPVALSSESISAVGDAVRSGPLNVTPGGKMPVTVDGKAEVEATIAGTPGVVLEGVPVVQLAPGTRVSLENTELFSQELADIRALINRLGGSAG